MTTKVTRLHTKQRTLSVTDCCRSRRSIDTSPPPTGTKCAHSAEETLFPAGVKTTTLVRVQTDKTFEFGKLVASLVRVSWIRAPRATRHATRLNLMVLFSVPYNVRSSLLRTRTRIVEAFPGASCLVTFAASSTPFQLLSCL